MSTHHRGAAVVVAMMIAALAATVAVALAADQQRWFADVTSRREQVQAQSLALAGVQWARQILQDDARSGTIDHLGEPWALSLPPTPIADGSIEGRIEDAQARLNLNNLVGDNQLSITERMRLGRVLSANGMSPGLLDAIADWIDSDGTPRASGAEDAAYRQAGATSLAANAPMVRTAELSSVRGLTAKDAHTLTPFVVALPAGAAVNINTASAAVLAAAFPELDGDALAGLITERARKPFTTMGDLRARLPPGVAIGDETSFTMSSNYFLVSVRSRQGNALAQARALLKRDGRDWPTVLWQTLE